MTRNNKTRAFLAYLMASSLWLAGMTLSSFLSSWLLVDRVGASPEQTGWASTLSRIVPLAFLLAGGVLVDRSNNRRYLVLMHLLIVVPGLVLASLVASDQLGYIAVVGFMVAMSALQALSDPARQSVLNRVAATDIQRSVTMVALTGSVVSFLAVTLGGAMDKIGDAPILITMWALFALGLWPILKLPNLPPLAKATEKSGAQSAISELLEGARVTASNRVLRPVIFCNFASSMFNAGAYTVALPFITKNVYAGDAQTFGWALGAITIGAGLSSVLLLLVMPFGKPGRVFLYFQLTRALILALMWVNFGEWVFYALMVLWGFNLGVTSTLARTVVQLEAPEAARGKVFSLMLLSFMLASAIGAPILGAIVGAADPLTALLPGVAVSVLIFAFGYYSRLWVYTDPAH